jgi:hypothetical protein
MCFTGSCPSESRTTGECTFHGHRDGYPCRVEEEQRERERSPEGGVVNTLTITDGHGWTAHLALRHVTAIYKDARIHRHAFIVETMSSGGEEGGFIFVYDTKKEMQAALQTVLAAFDAFHGRGERP